MFSNMINEKLFDEMLIFYSPKVVGKGKTFSGGLDIENIKKAFRYKIKSVEMCGEDIVVGFTHW